MSAVDEEQTLSQIKEGTKEPMIKEAKRKVSIRVEQPDSSLLTIPDTSLQGSSSADTLTGFCQLNVLLMFHYKIIYETN